MPVDRDRVATSTMHLTLPDTGDTDVTITETAGRHPIPLLHGGGGGPLTVSSFATQLAADEARDARVITRSTQGSTARHAPTASQTSPGSPRSTWPCSTS